MDAITAPTGQALTPSEQRYGTGLGEAGSQRHGVGVAAKELEPYALARLRRLVGQHADHLAFFQGLDQRSYARQIGWRQMQLGALAAHQDQFISSRRLRFAVEHGNVAERRQVLGGDLET